MDDTRRPSKRKSDADQKASSKRTRHSLSPEPALNSTKFKNAVTVKRKKKARQARKNKQRKARKGNQKEMDPLMEMPLVPKNAKMPWRVTIKGKWLNIYLALWSFKMWFLSQVVPKIRSMYGIARQFLHEMYQEVWVASPFKALLDIMMTVPFWVLFVTYFIWYEEWHLDFYAWVQDLWDTYKLW